MSNQPKSKSEMKRLNALQGRDIAEGVSEFGKSEQSKPTRSPTDISVIEVFQFVVVLAALMGAAIGVPILFYWMLGN